MMTRCIGWVSIIFCFWSIFISLYVYYTYTHPPRYISPVTPRDYGLRYEKVTFSTNDGLVLTGWFIPSSKLNVPTIIGCHGYPFDKGNILELTTFLYPEYNFFLFDFRGMGESEGKVTTVGFYEIRDLESAVEYLKARGVKEIGAIGFSLGAAVLIIANNPDIKAIVADSSFSDIDSVINILFKRLGPLKWPLVRLVKLWARIFMGIDIGKISPLMAMKDLQSPILFIHGELDTQMPSKHSRSLYEMGKSLGKDVQLWLVPNADHGQAYYMDPQEYSKRVKDFFNSLGKYAEKHVQRP